MPLLTIPLTAHHLRSDLSRSDVLKLPADLRQERKRAVWRQANRRKTAAREAEVASLRAELAKLQDEVRALKLTLGKVHLLSRWPTGSSEVH